MRDFHLVLASTSAYRRMLLSRFNLPFVVVSPNVVETPREGETPENLVIRLSEEKARAGGQAFLKTKEANIPARKTLIIGSDQVADCEGEAIGKPLTFDRAFLSLQQLSGKTVIFRTGLSLFCVAENRCDTVCVNVTTRYRALSDEEIIAYLNVARPFECAGAVRCEDLGIAMLDEIQSDDPTALIGLPLIALSRMMRAAGVNPVLCQPETQNH